MQIEQFKNLAKLFPQEIVTIPKLRIIQLPKSGKNFALITLDNEKDHTKLNTFGANSMVLLYELLTKLAAEVENKKIVGLAITGKPFILAAGADLSAINLITEKKFALLMGQLGHATFQKITNFPVPTFVFINGLALGGGLELALHAQYRTISTAVNALALPETFLGLIPGWGGCFLLPNLVGPKNALKIIIENPQNQNKMLNAAQAYKLGVADAIFGSADFLEESLKWAEKVIEKKVVVERVPVLRDESWDQAVFATEQFLSKKVFNKNFAPYKALELILAAKDAKAVEAFAAEDETIANLLMSNELHASLYSFFELIGKRSKNFVKQFSANKPIKKVGIVGAGLMASQLALLFVSRLKVPVVISDVSLDKAQAAKSYVTNELDKLVEKKKITWGEANRYKALMFCSVNLENFADTDFVIEAVFEDIVVKKQVFHDLEKIVSPETILASNTSALSISEMVKGLKYPNRVVGFHFFNPVNILPLVEVSKTAESDIVSLSTAMHLAKDLKKTAILVKDSTGFVVNRILLRVMSEVLQAFDAGSDIETIEDALKPLGLPMSTFSLLHLVGLPIAQHASESLQKSFGERFYVSPNISKLVAANIKKVVERDAQGKLYIPDQVRSLTNFGNVKQTVSEIQKKVEFGLAKEIQIMLNEKVVDNVADIDLALILGAGWPINLGGITSYLDKYGISEKINNKNFNYIS